MRLLVVLALPSTAAGQQVHTHAGRRWEASGAAQAIPLLTRATPTAGRRSSTEAYLTQPVLMGHVSVFGGRAAGHAMLNLEGATLSRGELNTGTYGEGFVDRRHPHSYVHELLATARADVGAGQRRAALSLTAGRGFAPFGSDDPMARPFAKYPVNHHLAQILERLVVVAAARSGPLMLEGGIFNGDEPTDPRSVPAWSRFGDSWSGRVTLTPARGVELAASVARVESPEFKEGLGLDQRKTSAVLRIAQPVAGGRGSRYVLAEWARTHDDRRGRVAFTFTSFLVEAAYCGRGPVPDGAGWTGALRIEQTTRPEEERQIDLFRTPRPQIEFAILGRTRWTVVTAASGTNAARLGVLTVAPFVEATYARAEAVEQLAAFIPREFYGSDRLWLLSLGARVNLGRRQHRMGRYGVALTDDTAQAAAASAC
ncbi:MAG: hypothetical protein M3303_10985 [Gemmatimonadota bacterium]|nr:hypothetical protein [Gemmatimonadota bacterium]